MSNGYALGIDLGTTYTAAAVARDGSAQVVALGTNTAAIPSVVFLKEGSTVLVGESAVRRAATDPSRVAREFKRRIGDPTPILLGGSPYAAEALMARLLRWTVDAVAEREGGPAAHVSVSHPANWGPYKLDLLMQSVRMADVKVDRYLTEPEAAAISWAAAEHVESGTIVTVYDLGGGTFDAAVLRKTDDDFEILGEPEGIERLGGVDFDQALLAHVASALGGAIEELDLTDPAVLSALARLRQEVVDAKEALSTDTDTVVPVLLPGLNTDVHVTRAEFEAMIRPPLADTVGALRRALRSAGVAPDDLGAVVLVGGSSRIPLVAELIGEEIGRPVAVDAHPKHAVALGAAMAASGAPLVQAGAPALLADAPAVVADAPVVIEPAAAPPAVAAEPPAPPMPPSRQPAPASPGSARQPVGRRKRRTRALAAAVVIMVALVAVGVGALLLGGGDESKAVAVTCPRGPAVCLTGTRVEDGAILADFRPIGVELANPSDGVFPSDSVHPVFYFRSREDNGRAWGSSSPFGAVSKFGFQGFDVADQPSGTPMLCGLLQDEHGNVFSKTGNCVPVTGT